MTARQVDVALELLVVAAVATGLLSWAVGTSWSRIVTVVHAVTGFLLVALAPAKLRGSVRTGLARKRASRWFSVTFGGLVLATILLGVVHSTGLWFGVGPWSALWTHELAAFTLLGLFLWHILSRPGRPKLAELDRRAALRMVTLAALAAAAYGTQQLAVRALGLAGGRRRFTGSHEVASFHPEQMPTVSWINDEAPAETDECTWSLHITGRSTSIAELRRQAQSVTATLDCTGGWYSRQSWDAVPLGAVLDGQSARSIKVTSATGYSRLFPSSDRHVLYLAVGYGGRPLRRAHGAPVRLVAPGRRGPWWVKWVTSVQLDDRPWWLQTPFPLE